jgi:hypothetical protein
MDDGRRTKAEELKQVLLSAVMPAALRGEEERPDPRPVPPAIEKAAARIPQDTGERMDAPLPLPQQKETSQPKKKTSSRKAKQ